MVAATDSRRYRCAPRDGLGLSERGRDRPAAARRVGARFTGKTGQRGDHRPRAVKTGHRGDHRLRGAKPFAAGSDDPAPAKPAIEVITDSGAELAASAPYRSRTEPGRSPSASACAPYRDAIEVGLSRGRNAMAIWQDLVDTVRLHRRLSERPALRAQAARQPVAGSPRRDRDRARRRGPGRLRRQARWCATRTAASTGARGCSC